MCLAFPASASRRRPSCCRSSDLDNLLANIDRVTGAKRQENLRASGPILEMSRQLVKLADDVPTPMEWDAWRLKEIDAKKMLDLCQELGFRSFAAEVRETVQSTAVVQHRAFSTTSRFRSAPMLRPPRNRRLAPPAAWGTDSRSESAALAVGRDCARPPMCRGLRTISSSIRPRSLTISSVNCGSRSVLPSTWKQPVCGR